MWTALFFCIKMMTSSTSINCNLNKWLNYNFKLLTSGLLSVHSNSNIHGFPYCLSFFTGLMISTHSEFPLLMGSPAGLGRQSSCARCRPSLMRMAHWWWTSLKSVFLNCTTHCRLTRSQSKTVWSRWWLVMKQLDVHCRSTWCHHVVVYHLSEDQTVSCADDFCELNSEKNE